MNPTKDYEERMQSSMLTSNSGESSESITTIFDVVEDCLDLIFNHLDALDLVRVALAHDKFYSVASRVFKRMYRKTELIVYPSEVSFLAEPNVEKYMTDIIKQFNQLTFLRMFGNFPSRLIIESNVNATMKEKMDHYVNEYCSESITTIQYRANFSRELAVQNYMSHTQAEQTLPWNSQIKDLAIKYRNTWDIGLTSNFFNNQRFKLDTLSIACGRGYLAVFDWEKLKFGKMKRFTMEISGPFPTNSPPISFESLEVLELKGESWLTKDWFEFIKQHKDLKQLKIIIDVAIQQDRHRQLFPHLCECIEMLPKLQMLMINANFIHADNLAAFLLTSNSLTEVRLYWSPWQMKFKASVEFEETITVLNGWWNAYFGVGRVTFLREQP